MPLNESNRDDPLIDEVRAIRRSISERFGNDVDALCDYLQKLEREHPELVVNFEKPAAGSSVSRPRE
jgi:hypothetical protein